MILMKHSIVTAPLPCPSALKCRGDCIQLQDDLDTIYNWSQKWQLHLNTAKCKFPCISNKRSPYSFPYSLNNQPLEWVSKYKYLGVCINSTLSWSDHITATTHKATRILNLLRRTMYQCIISSKKMAVNALVRPHLDFCAPVWSPHLSKDKLALEKVQKRAGHWICSKWDHCNHKWSKSYKEVCSELKWPTIHQRHTMLPCCQIYNVINSLDCINFNHYFSHVTRSSRRHASALSCVQSHSDIHFLSIVLTYGIASLVMSSSQYHLPPLNVGSQYIYCHNKRYLVL